MEWKIIAIMYIIGTLIAYPMVRYNKWFMQYVEEQGHLQIYTKDAIACMTAIGSWLTVVLMIAVYWYILKEWIIVQYTWWVVKKIKKKYKIKDDEQQGPEDSK